MIADILTHVLLYLAHSLKENVAAVNSKHYDKARFLLHIEYGHYLYQI